jgi:hypothetical protein
VDVAGHTGEVDNLDLPRRGFYDFAAVVAITTFGGRCLYSVPWLECLSDAGVSSASVGPHGGEVDVSHFISAARLALRASPSYQGATSRSFGDDFDAVGAGVGCDNLHQIFNGQAVIAPPGKFGDAVGSTLRVVRPNRAEQAGSGILGRGVEDLEASAPVQNIDHRLNTKQNCTEVRVSGQNWSIQVDPDVMAIARVDHSSYAEPSFLNNLRHKFAMLDQKFLNLGAATLRHPDFGQAWLGEPAFVNQPIGSVGIEPKAVDAPKVTDGVGGSAYSEKASGGEEVPSRAGGRRVNGHEPGGVLQAGRWGGPWLHKGCLWSAGGRSGPAADRSESRQHGSGTERGGLFGRQCQSFF